MCCRLPLEVAVRRDQAAPLAEGGPEGRRPSPAADEVERPQLLELLEVLQAHEHRFQAGEVDDLRPLQGGKAERAVADGEGRGIALTVARVIPISNRSDPPILLLSMSFALRSAGNAH